MANVDIRLGYKDGAWFAANASLVLKTGQYVALLGTGLYKLGDGVTTLSALPFLGNMTTIPNGLQSGGAITVVTDDITVAAASWLISPNIYATAVGTDFLNIALSSAGNQRYIGFYGNTSNAIVKVEGAEAAIASYPTTPANTIVIGYVLVSDASISVLPDLSGYEEKVNKTDTVIGNETSSIKYPSIKALYDWVTSLFVKKGTLTANYIQKATSTDTIGDSVIYQDGSNIGIGLTSTSAKLHAKGTGSTSATYVAKFDNSVGNVVSITDEGNIGIGTNAPLNLMHIKAADLKGFSIYNTSNNNTIKLFPNSGFGGVLWLNADDGNNKIQFASTGTSFLNNGNNFGVGTSSPGDILTVNTTSDLNGITLTKSGTTSFRVFPNSGFGGVMYLNDDSGTTKIRLTGNGASSWIDNGQSFGLGIQSPSASFHVKGTGSTSATYVAKFDNSVGDNLLSLRDDGVSEVKQNPTTALGIATKGFTEGLTWLTNQIWGTWINGLTSKTTPVDADQVVLMDSADTNKSKKISWANTKTTLANDFDTDYTLMTSFRNTYNY